MLSTLSVLLASAVALSGGDTVKKKAPATPTPHKPAKGLTASVAIARAASETMTRFAGATAGKTIAAAAHAATPKATFLSAAISARVRPTSGPPLPERFRTETNGSTFSADSIVVEKARRTMTLYRQGEPVRIYFVALGSSPVGPKEQQGDGRTPEGIYRIAAHNPDSKYHLSLLVSYPNERDAANAKARGVATGGSIMVHGLPDRFASYGSAHRNWDWTEGCIAVTNAEIEEIWSAIPDGAMIQIKP